MGNEGDSWAIKWWGETETLCWLCDKYGHLARYCRVISSYMDDGHKYSVDRRLEPREELLWEGARVCGVVTCSFAKPARPTIIAWETQEKVRIQQRDTDQGFHNGGCVNVHTRVIYVIFLN